MKNNNILLYFSKWIQENESKFNIKPYIRKSDFGHYEICLQGIQNIRIYIDNSGNAMVSAVLNSETHDILTDFNVIERQFSEGYYSELCEDKKLYPTREKLWEAHVFTPLLQWINENIIAGNSLCFYQTQDGGTSWVKIIPTKNLASDNESLYLIHKINFTA